MAFDSAIDSDTTKTVDTTTQDFTSSGFGTPDAALFFYTRASGGAGSVDDHWLFSQGGTDKTSEFAITCRRTHGQGNTDCWRDLSTTSVAIGQISGSGSRVDDASYTSTVTDGLRITWDNATTAANHISGLLLKADNAWLGTATLGNQNVSTTFTPGFEAGVLIVFSQSATGNGSFSTASTGFAVWNGSTVTQCCCAVAANDNRTTAQPVAYVASARCGAQVNAPGSLGYSVEADNFTSTAFDLTPRDGSSGGDRFFVLALDIGSNSAWTGVVDTPTSTGNTANTTPGFTPQFGMHVMTNVESVNTAVNDATSGCFGVSMFNSTTQNSHAVCDEDAASTTNTSSVFDTKVAHMPNDDNTDAIEGAFVSFDANGWTTNYTNVLTNAKKWPTLMIEEDAGAPTAGVKGSLALLGVGI